MMVGCEQGHLPESYKAEGETGKRVMKNWKNSEYYPPMSQPSVTTEKHGRRRFQVLAANTKERRSPRRGS